MWRRQGRAREGSSGVYPEGQQLFRVHVVEGAEVGQFEEQLGEPRGFAGVVLHDQSPQHTDQRLLQLVHRVNVLNPGTIYI